MNMSNMLRDIIDTHEKSSAVQMMKAAKEYYGDKHDILEKDFRQSWVYETKEAEYGDSTYEQAELMVNQNCSNHHNVHNYYAQLVDQEADYISGNPPAVSIEGAGSDPNAGGTLKAFEDVLTKRTSDEEFAQLISDTIIDARNGGVAYWHPYYDANGKFKATLLPSHEVIPIFDTQYQNSIVSFIRYYTIAVVVNGYEGDRTRVEWWDDKGVTYYIEDEYHKFNKEVFPDGRGNPAPHWVEVSRMVATGEVTETPRVWGMVPLIQIRANRDKKSLLERVKGLQDAYNMVSSKLTNDEIDLVALYWIIQGYGGEAAGQIKKKLELNKAISMDDPEGKVSAEQVTLATSDRIQFLDNIKKDIFALGEGLIPDMERSGNINTTELHMRYSRLKMKANRMTRELKVALKKLFEFMVMDINAEERADYDPSLIRVEFHFDEIINETELIDNILKLKGFVPDSILMQLVPYVDDPNQAFIELQKQKTAEAKAKADAFSVPRSGASSLNAMGVDGKVQQSMNATQNG